MIKFDSISYKLYLNGTLVNTFKPYWFSGPVGTSTDSVTVGGIHSTTYNYALNALLDDLRLYNRALSAAEVAQYHGMSSVGIPPLTSTFSLVDAYPNPSNGSFAITGDVTSNTPVKITVTTTLGQMVYADEAIPQGNKLNKNVSLNGVGNGVYYIHLKTGNESKNYKIVIQQ